MALFIPKNSRLRFGEFLEDPSLDGFQFWDLLDLPEIPVQTDDQYYVVQTFDRIDRLANKFYGDPVLWWVIAVANNMEDVVLDLAEGKILRIPSAKFVSQVLFSKPIPRV